MRCKNFREKQTLRGNSERGRGRRLILLAVGLIWVGIGSGLLLGIRPAWAQEKPAKGGDKNAPSDAKSDAKDAKSADVSDVAPLFVALDDLGELRVLNPLKLTADELDKVAAIISDSQTEYNKKIAANAAPVLRKASDVILAAKKKALGGAVVPLDDTLIKAMSDYEARRKETENATLKALSEKLQTVLTEAQIAAAAKVAKDESAKLTGAASKGTDAQFFNLYVLRVVMGYPRLTPLLKEMRAARTAAK